MNVTRDRRPHRRRLLFVLHSSMLGLPWIPPDPAGAAETGLDTRLPVARGGFIATAHGPAAAHVLPAAMAFRPGNARSWPPNSSTTA